MSSFFAPTSLVRDRFILFVLFIHLCFIIPFSIISNHIHVLIPAMVAYCASLIGIRLAGGTFVSRAVLAVSLIVFSATLIHLSDGLIEVHFHIFFSLVLLSIYYDWRVIAVAATSVVIHHFIGLFSSVFTVYEAHASVPIYMLHVIFVAITGAVLCYLCEVGQRSVGTISLQNEQLKNTVENLNHARSVEYGVSDELISVVSHLNIATDQQNNTSQEQASALIQINTTLSELAQAAQNIKTRAQVIDNAAVRVLEVTQLGENATKAAATTGQEGQHAVIETRKAITSMVDVYGALVIALGELLERSINLKSIAQMLRDISRQTHLLSLNATIEAVGVDNARAGRFHIVASQVKSLAQDSIQISNQADAIIHDIETRIVRAVLIAESGQRHAAIAMATAHQSGAQITTLVDMVQQSATDVAAIAAEAGIMVSLTTEIGSATTQQAQAVAGAVATLQSTADHAEATVLANQQIVQTAQTLNHLAKELAKTFAD